MKAQGGKKGNASEFCAVKLFREQKKPFCISAADNGRAEREVVETYNCIHALHSRLTSRERERWMESDGVLICLCSCFTPLLVLSDEVKLQDVVGPRGNNFMP